MFKKITAIAAAFVIMTSSVYAESMTVFKESDHVEEAVEKLMAGEAVPILDLLKFPEDDNEGIMTLSDDTDDTTDYTAYSQLDDVEKAIYDGLDENYASTMDGTTGVECTVSLPLTAGYNRYTTQGKTSISSAVDAYVNDHLGYELTRAVYALYAYDKPQYFWLNVAKMSVSVAYRYSGYDKETGACEVTATITYAAKDSNGSALYTDYYYGNYTDADEVQSEYDAIYAKADEIIASFPENASDFQKLYIMNEWLLNHNTYNPNLSSGTASFYAYIPLSALLYGDGDDTTKYPICEGYAEAIKIICDRAGIGCVCGEAFNDADGDGDYADDSDGHKWNLVQLDGKWYYLDATWNDSSDLSYIYYRTRQFLVGITSMKKVDNTQSVTIYHDLDKAQLGFTVLANPEATDYIDDVGLASIVSLDIYKDNNLTGTDIAQTLHNIINSSLSVDINEDGSNDLLDAIAYERLMYK